MTRNRYHDTTYQSKILNRLARMVSLRGDLSDVRESLDRAMERIWSELETAREGVAT